MTRRNPAHTLVLTFAEWPAIDRQAWEALFVQGDDVFSERGVARHWRIGTRSTNRDHYGRWLRWLIDHDALDSELKPGARVTPELVRRFMDDLRGSVSPRTVASRVGGLSVVTSMMDPSRDWRWLKQLSARLGATASPSVDRSACILPIEDIHFVFAQELDRLATSHLRQKRELVAFRDAMIVMVFTTAPLRIRNLASIEIDRHLVRSGDTAMLRFIGAETKTGKPLALDLPRHSIPWLNFYLDRIRPALGPEAGCRRLWLGISGRPLSIWQLRFRVMAITERLLGVAINPHSFRACVATSFARLSPDMALMAAPLLGHADFRTTERYYIKAQQIDASRRVNALIRSLRGKSPRGAHT